MNVELKEKRKEFIKQRALKYGNDYNTLTLFLTVKNEENYIKQAIESGYAIADEIVIVDTGSTDKTIDIIKSIDENIKIIYTDWNDNFSIPKNIGLDNCTSNWILRIDADERIPSECVNEFWKLSQVKNNEIVAYLVPIKNYFEYPEDEKDPPFFISETLRLFKNHPKIRYSGDIHEDIDDSINKVNLGLDNINILITDKYIEHFGYTRNKVSLKEKHEKYANILLKQIEKDPTNHRPYFNLAVHYAAIRNFEKAKEYYEKCLKVCDKFYPALNGLSVIYFYEGNIQKAKYYVLKAFEYLPLVCSSFIKRRMEINKKNILNTEKNILSMLIT